MLLQLYASGDRNARARCECSSDHLRSELQRLKTASDASVEPAVNAWSCERLTKNNPLAAAKTLEIDHSEKGQERRARANWDIPSTVIVDAHSNQSG